MFLTISSIRRIRATRGLSLQEMLVVIAVFTILAIIIFMSSQHVLIKTKVSRVNQEQRVISDALAEYVANEARFPSTEQGLNEIAARTSHLNAVPYDPFLMTPQKPYMYYKYEINGSNLNSWLVVSAGPDGDLDFDPGFLKISGWPAMSTSSASSPHPDPLNRMIHYINANTYDPTNGIDSSGDIFKIDPNTASLFD